MEDQLVTLLVDFGLPAFGVFVGYLLGRAREYVRKTPNKWDDAIYDAVQNAFAEGVQEAKKTALPE